MLLTIEPDLALSGWTMLCGGSVSLLLLSTLQISFGPNRNNFLAATAPADEIQQRSQTFEKQVRRATLEQLLGVLGLLFLGWWSDRVWGGVIVAAAMYITYQVSKRGSARATTLHAVYRSQLERRRDALRSIWSWYVGPYLGALMIFAWRIPLTHPEQRGLWPNILPFTVLSLVWSFAMGKLAERAARKIQEDIDALDALENKQPPA